MNYYIQGSPTRAEEIKAAFDEKGYDTKHYTFDNDNLLFYTINGDYIPFLDVRIMREAILINIIKTHPDYKELELSFESKFKVLDWIVSSSGIIVGIINKIRHYGYFVELMNGEEVTFTKNHIEQDFHLWTIEDAKDGDVLSYQGEVFITRIARGLSANVAIDYDCCYDGNSFILDSFYSLTMDELKEVYPATKQQRDLLFAKMKEAGYKWDADKKELRKIKPHYDIANFYAGMPVLVRNGICLEWEYVTFSHYRNVRTPFCAGGQYWYQCIPFNDNTKHLLGTTGMCAEEFINWVK